MKEAKLKFTYRHVVLHANLAATAIFSTSIVFVTVVLIHHCVQLFLQQHTTTTTRLACAIKMVRKMSTRSFVHRTEVKRIVEQVRSVTRLRAIR